MKQVPEGIVVVNDMKSLLMKSFDVDIRRNGIALSLGMRQPRLLRTGGARIVDTIAAFTKRTKQGD
jgi:hypothetical protein